MIDKTVLLNQVKGTNMRLKSHYYLRLLSAAYFSLLLIGCADELTLCPDGNHPHAIDLGLPSGTLWSCCNLGAPSPGQTGGYYAWGETDIKQVYDEQHYSSDFEHSYLGEYRKDLPEHIAGSLYDAATQKWGSSWHIPTPDQIYELLRYCKIEYNMEHEGTKGIVIVGPSGNSIFLPSTGTYYGARLSKLGEGGTYWSDAQRIPQKVETGAINPYGLEFSTTGSAFQRGVYLWAGSSIRPVKE